MSYVIACPTYCDAKNADLVKGYLSYLRRRRRPGRRGQGGRVRPAVRAALSSDEVAKQVDTIKAG